MLRALRCLPVLLTLMGSGCSLALTNDFQFPSEPEDASVADAATEDAPQRDAWSADAGVDAPNYDGGADGGPLVECVRTSECTPVSAATVRCVDGACVATCDTGRADCDGDLTNGCEVNLLDDVAHCGACMTSCAAEHTSATCNAGSCIRTCDANYADCDRTLPDCETSLGTASNCASCGNNCGAGNFCDATSGSPVCALECLAPGTVCGAACVDTRSSTAHCGGCGLACAPANAEGLCASSVCEVGACDVDFDDCNGLISDGCETPLRTTENCGACGATCALANATESCASGRCELTSCEAGFADCNMTAADGCETNLLDDERACGACGNACEAGATCTAGVCDVVVDVALGLDHTCALRESGQVWCWGSNVFGQLGDGTVESRVAPGPAAGAFRFDQLTAGGGFTCGIERTTRRVLCWGRNGYGELGDNTVANRVLPVPLAPRIADAGFAMRTFSEVRAMGSGACARESTGDVWCWGRNDFGMVGIDPTLSPTLPGPPPHVNGAVRVAGVSGVSELAPGANHVCARSADRVFCWGQNSMGQLGDGTFATRFAPAPIGLTGVTRIASTPTSTCALLMSGAVHCWGRNMDGELGMGAAPPARNAPVANGVVADQLHCGANFCLARTTTGWVAWGTRNYGQHGDGSEGVPRVLPAPVTLPATMSLRTGYAASACGIQGGRLLCWGADLNGQLGVRSQTVQSPQPVHDGMAPIGSIEHVATGGTTTCVVVAGQVRCAGANDTNILARAGSFPAASAIPLAISGIPSPARSVAVGRNFACAIGGADGARQVFCWGASAGIASSATPMAVTITGGEPVSIAAGFAHVCALVLRTSGERVAQCWGSNGVGELGRGSAGAADATPTAVLGLTDVAELELGEAFSCARRSTGQLACWGRNFEGQLGDGTTTSRTVPTAVLTISDASDLAVGAAHACAVTSTGARCWGLNSERQLGIASAANQSMPVSPLGLPLGVSAIAAGGRHTCALAAGRPYCWGNNVDGQLGLATRTPLAGVQMLATTDAVSIVASRNSVVSSSHTCVLRSDGTAQCWGLATSGRCASGEPLWLTVPTPSRLPY